MATTPYNPLDKTNLGASVAEALLGRRAASLDELRTFDGAGIYAIYYSGDFAAYAALAKRNRDNRLEAPIYVGKAVPQGARKGAGGLDASSTKALFKRLGEHADTIRATKLNLADFQCRYLVVDDIWIPLGESLLIAKFAPIWNSIIDGFGNHDPGSGRYQGMRPSRSFHQYSYRIGYNNHDLCATLDGGDHGGKDKTCGTCVDARAKGEAQGTGSIENRASARG